MIKTPVNVGLLQSDVDFAGFKPLNADLSDYDFGGGGGTSPLITVNVKDAPYNAVGDGVADDTVAIQNAINAVVALGGGTVFFPRGIYLCNGAFDLTFNSILKIPQVSVTATAMVGIELLGETFSYWGSASLYPGTNFSIIKSTKVGTGTEPALLACNPFQGYGAIGYTYFNNIMLRIKNMAFQTTTTSLDGLRLDMAGGASVENVMVTGGGYGVTSTITGLWMPNTGNFAITSANNVLVSGYGIGMRIGEHFRAPNILVGVCETGLSFMEANEPSWANVTFLHCKHFIDFTGTHSVEVFVDVENATPGDFYQTTAHVYDPSNYGGGFVKYNLIDAGVGYSPNPIIVNGGARINLMDLHGGSSQWKSARFQSYTVATLPASPALGQVAAVSDGTASLAWGATVTGGGSTKYLVWYNGTNWTVAGK